MNNILSLAKKASEQKAYERCEINVDELSDITVREILKAILGQAAHNQAGQYFHTAKEIIGDNSTEEAIKREEQAIMWLQERQKMKETNKIKLCPFCGNRIMSINDDSYGMYVYCDICGAQGAKKTTKLDAIEAWNRRAKLNNET